MRCGSRATRRPPRRRTDIATRGAGLRDALRARGEALHWHPPFMGQRYAHWVDGLNGDWLISRQP
ncbi:hypothetical protein CFB84_38170 [Burkholderia aenigmatica]|uniref:Uncharacterized protein n=1 Tax=Burkholderia aenigmatica TaxID=2015348 RepID=A0A228HTQ2_9BURK|nr:hypothetical protein CFB84_38170 [Burkholderia aenigmatica]